MTPTALAMPAASADPHYAGGPTVAETPDRRTTLLQRGSLAVLLLGTLAAYLWNLSANGWANSFYTAAIQAGSQSWKAWFFGSSDMANSITVDKPPASLWIPALSVRVFGLNSWSLLVPQVLMGVATVWLLYVIVKRYFGHWAGIGAGAVLALTPVAALMFRFNNPEALLLLLMTAAVWTLMRALETGRLKWMLWCGVAVGFGFLTKQLQVFLILPALVIVYFTFADGSWRRRVGHLFAALGALIVSAGWWLLAVELWPADKRPWIGGSQNNSILELTLGYNGFGRLNGNERGSVVPGGGDREFGAGQYFPGMGNGNGMGGNGSAEGFPGFPGGGGRGGMWGQSGPWRMFDAEQGGQISWLIPAALILFVAALVVIGRSARTDLRRGFLVLSALWLLTTMVVFSFMQGIFHSYYTAALAPALAGLLAASAAVCWQARQATWVRAVLAAASTVTAVWGFVLLGRSPEFVPWLRWVVLVVGVVAGLALIAVHRGLAGRAVAGAAIVAALAGPTAYVIDTLNTPAQGSIISAGPRVEGAFGPGGMGGRGGPRGGAGMPGGFPGGMPPGGTAPGGQFPGGQVPGGQLPGGQFPGGQFPGGQLPGGQGSSGAGSDGQAQWNGGDYAGRRDGFGGGPAGGLLNGSKPSEAVVAKLRQNADEFTWVAAAVGSNQASGFQIESGYSVMPIGGFNGTDPSPTLAQFQKYVAEGKIHYFIGGGMGGGMGRGGEGTSASIREWVEANFDSTEVDGVTLYDLTQPKAAEATTQGG